MSASAVQTLALADRHFAKFGPRICFFEFYSYIANLILLWRIMRFPQYT